MAESNGTDGEAAAKREKRFRIFGGILAICALAAGGYWLANRNYESTDDAFIDADIVQLAPQIGGIVAEIAFTDNQTIEKGQVLLRIDPRDAEAQAAAAKAALQVAMAQRDAAEADLALTRTTTGAAVDEAHHLLEQLRRLTTEARQQADAAEADAQRAAADVKRYQDLVAGAVASRQRFDQAVADARSSSARWKAALTAVTALESQQSQAEARLHDAEAAPQRIAQKTAQLANAAAQVAQAAANLQAAELALSYTTVTAPQAGRMANRAVNAGDVVQKGQVLAQLVAFPPRVIANFKETQLSRMAPGQTVSITVDALAGRRFRGRVDSLQPGTGARFSLLPPENATGNFVKLVQRVPVKILFDEADPEPLRRLAPGMSVEPEVDLASGPGQ